MRLRELRQLVEQLVAGGGGGGGLVVGPWTNINYSAVAPGNFPADPDTLDIAALSVPWEFWMTFVRTEPGANGFQLMDPIGGDTYDASNDDAMVGKIRAIVPANIAVQLFPSGDVSTISIDIMKQRTLG